MRSVNFGKVNAHTRLRSSPPTFVDSNARLVQSCLGSSQPCDPGTGVECVREYGSGLPSFCYPLNTIITCSYHVAAARIHPIHHITQHSFLSYLMLSYPIPSHSTRHCPDQVRQRMAHFSRLSRPCVASGVVAPGSLHR